MRARASLAIPAAFCALVLGVLPAAAGDAARLPAKKVVSEWPNWPFRTSCYNLTFDPNVVFSEVPEAGLGNSSLDRALRHVTKLLAVKRSIHGWRLARRVPGRAAFVRGQPGAELESGRELEYLELGKRRGRWEMEHYGQRCYLSTLREQRWADPWLLSPDQPPLGPNTQTIRVITGAHCSRKEKPPVIDGQPSFIEFEGKLVMTLWLRHRGGGPNEACAWDLPPWPPIEVSLPEPLGDRELFDGGEYPPRPASVYEEPTVIPLQAASRSARLRQ